MSNSSGIIRGGKRFRAVFLMSTEKRCSYDILQIRRHIKKQAGYFVWIGLEGYEDKFTGFDIVLTVNGLKTNSLTGSLPFVFFPAGRILGVNCSGRKKDVAVASAFALLSVNPAKESLHGILLRAAAPPQRHLQVYG